jgi:hypothetical protein
MNSQTRMRPTFAVFALALLLAALLVVSGMNRPPEVPAAAPTPETATPTATAAPEKQRISLPPGYRADDLLYAIIDRPDGITRKLYVSPAALDAVRRGEDFPDGAQIVVEAFDAARDANGSPMRDSAGRLIPGAMRPEIHVAETRSTWRMEDLASSARLGNFNFAAFDAATGGHNGEFIADCFSCHDQAARTGFVFTRRELQAYASTGETQYSYCNQPARVPCPF